MAIAFKILAVILAGIAVFFLWSGSRAGVFVALALACVSFFLGMRTEIKARNDARDAERRQQE